MTEEDVKYIIKYEQNKVCKECDPLGFGCVSACDFCDTRYAYDFAIECIEKQTPKLPIIKQLPQNLGGLKFVCCPTCEYTNVIQNRCPKCGQKIDWSD